jgi:hypothetical protein
MCISFRVWLLHLRSMCGALSDPSHKGHVGRPCRMAKPFGVLVCVYRVRPVLKELFLLHESHIWHGPECVTELGKGLCIRLLCMKVGLCCTLGRIMQCLPELVNQCSICVSFIKVMMGVHVMF